MTSGGHSSGPWGTAEWSVVGQLWARSLDLGGTRQGPWIWAVWKQDWKGGWVVGLSPLEWTGGGDV